MESVLSGLEYEQSGGPAVTLDDIRNLHAQDMRAIEEAIYLITYGDGEGIDDEAEPTP